MSETGKTPSPVQSTNRKTLKIFIDENDKLLTAIGVMGALAALFTTVKNGEYLAFLSFLLLLILDFQLIMLTPKIRDSAISLVVFEIVLQVFFIAILEYIIQQYPKYFVLFIQGGEGLVVVSGYYLLRRKYSRRTSVVVAGILYVTLTLIYLVAKIFLHISSFT